MRLLIHSALLVLTAVSGVAQNITPEIRQDVGGFKLNLDQANRICDAMAELTGYTLKQPNWQQELMDRMKKPLSEQAKDLAADPGSVAILRKHRLEAREYVPGILALRAAVLAAKGQTSGWGSLASPANIALVKSSPALVQKFEAAEMTGVSSVRGGKSSNANR
jgi:hypothetical protein